MWNVVEDHIMKLIAVALLASLPLMAHAQLKPGDIKIAKPPVLTSPAQPAKSDAPAGYSWIVYPEGKLRILKPNGWNMLKERNKDGNYAISLSVEDIAKQGKFLTGLTYNFVPNFRAKGKIAPSQYAPGFLQSNRSRYAKATPVKSISENGFMHYSFTGQFSNKTVVMVYVVADDKFDTLRSITCEAPEAVWTRSAEKQCRQMLSTLQMMH